MGNNLVRYKAEIDFDGRELTRSYLDKNDLTAMLKVRGSYKVFMKCNAVICYRWNNSIRRRCKL